MLSVPVVVAFPANPKKSFALLYEPKAKVCRRAVPSRGIHGTVDVEVGHGLVVPMPTFPALL